MLVHFFKFGTPLAVREELFIVSKVWNADQGYENTLKAFDESLKRLEMDYLDLYLIHWPVAGKYKDTWKALEKLYAEGRVKAIGVSNFMQHHLGKRRDQERIHCVVKKADVEDYYYNIIEGLPNKEELEKYRWIILQKLGTKSFESSI